MGGGEFQPEKIEAPKAKCVKLQLNRTERVIRRRVTSVFRVGVDTEHGGLFYFFEVER